jgi:hypothetical protein
MNVGLPSETIKNAAIRIKELEIDTMDHIKQIIAIAEYCGWKEIGKSGVYQNTIKGINGCVPGGEVHRKRIQMNLPGANSFLVPNYLNDLNAMHEAEETLQSHHLCYEYYNKLYNILGNTVGNRSDKPHHWTWHAAASQRAEAFLKTIGKWEE